MPHQTIPEDPQPSPTDGSSELRQRKRVRVKLMVQREALRLFADKGYDQTTVDDIAHAAAMSPRTFFRYFPTKEDVVLWDEYDERPLQQALQIRPGQDPLAQLVLRILDMAADIYHKDPELLLARTKLTFEVPEIRARFFNAQLTLIGPHYKEIARAVGVSPDDLGLPAIVTAIYSALLVATERWQRGDGREDLLSLLDDAITAIADGASYVRDTVRAAGAGNPPAKSAADAARRGRGPG